MLNNEGQTQCPNLGHQDAGAMLCPVFVERAARLMANPEKIAEIGSAMPLLAYILQACRDSDGCRIKYSDVAATTGAADITIKNWGQKLADLGYIKKKMAGPAGQDITLLDKLPAAFDCAALSDTVRQVQELLGGLKLTIASALDDGRHRLATAMIQVGGRS